VYAYTRDSGRFSPIRLARESQAMAIALYDVNGDGHNDIVVGNDFAVHDQAWLRQGNDWVFAEPFRQTSHSTMGFDQADIDNNGLIELFSTDMKPYVHDVGTMARWLPIMKSLWTAVPVGDPQIMENVLQAPDGRGGFQNDAYRRGLDATGWSWSAIFGDLDRDGWLDLYAVNGMKEREIFAYLPNHELVEVNQALRNTGDGSFVPQPGWGLGSTASGRGQSMADLDGDGDLDIVVNNLEGAAQLFENRLCGGSNLIVELRWPSSGNTRALGATLRLHTSTGTYTREVRSSAGYLSGAAPAVHFGAPAGARPDRLEIHWPDGALSVVNAPALQNFLQITRQ
jgi:hypothetical protein